MNNEQMELTDFLHAGTNSSKLKAARKIFGCGQSGDGNLKLAISQK